MGAGEVVAMGGETRLLESNAQLGFGFAQPASTGEVEQAPREERFLSGAAGDFFVGAQVFGRVSGCAPARLGGEAEGIGE